MEVLDIIGSVFDWNAVKGMIYPVLLPVEKACEGPAEYRRVYRNWLDLAVCYVVRLSEREDAEECLNVLEKLLPEWKVDEEMIYQQAIENLKRDGYRVMEIKQAVREAEQKMGLIWEDGREKELPFDLWVFSNRSCRYGAAGILDREKMRYISATLGGKNLHILPSSVHETILLPEDKKVEVSELNEMIYEINRTSVDEKDRLADHSYYYNHATGEITY